MPLIQSASKEALQKNIATEIKAGKDPKQASAIAYSIQRKNDSEEKNYKYIMYGTTGEKEVNNLTKSEAETLLKNNRMLGYDGKVVKMKDTNEHYILVDKYGKIIRHAKDLEEARYFKSSFIKAGEYGVNIKEVNSGRIIDMKNYKVKYDDRTFIVKATDKKDAAEKVANKVVDEGELVAKYEKKVGTYPATSAIIKHPKGYSFISAIVREDKDFPDLQRAENWAKGLGYTKISDHKCKDKNIPNKLEDEIYAEIEDFVKTYSIQGYINIVISKNKVTIKSEIGYNMLDKLLNKLTNIMNKYGSGATFNIDADGKAVAILKDSKLKLKDTLEILQTDDYKVCLDGNWVEITTRNGESIYSGSTTARTTREALEIAKKQHIIDKNIVDGENQTFELNGKRQIIFRTGNFVAMENGQVYDKGYLGSSKYNSGKGWSTDEYIKHLKSLGYREVKDSCITKDADYDQPKYKSGQKFEHDSRTYQITGTKEVTADYNTGRKGIVYEIKDLSKGQTFTQPCWELEKYVDRGNYKLKDSKITDGPFDKGQAYYYARTGDYVEIDGVQYRINADEGKIGYSDVIGLTEVKTGKHTKISKQDFIKNARLYKYSDSKSYKVTCGKRTFIVDACSKKEAATKIVNRITQR